MGSDIDRRNAESLARMRALAGRLSDEQLAKVVDPPWTAAALFAHIGFWDRFTEERWKAALDSGRETPPEIPDEAVERINPAGLHEWLAMPPRTAVRLCLSAAEAIDRLIAALPGEVVESVGRSERARLADRSLHREDHLPAIESTFGA